MKSTLTAFALATGFTNLVAAHDQHEHDHVVDIKEPFIGWTQEDLDAKWGTDVRLSLSIQKAILT
jgi:agmatinase